MMHLTAPKANCLSPAPTLPIEAVACGRRPVCADSEAVLSEKAAAAVPAVRDVFAHNGDAREKARDADGAGCRGDGKRGFDDVDVDYGCKGDDCCDSSSKPHFFSLCTKCANEGKEKSQQNRREPVRGLIIRSESFVNASEASRWEVETQCNSRSGGEGASGSQAGDGRPVSPRPDKPVFDRSKIVHEVLLQDGRQITDIYDTPNGTNLGKGSYGSVVKAKDIKTGIMRAIKVVYKPRIDNVTRLKREILIMKRLDHPNIIKLLEVYEDSKNLYLVMELCTGGELFERIMKSGHFSERYAASLMKQVFSAASYCHSQNVIHRDLKPENLLYADSSPLSALKVIDWGFAARCGKSHKFSSVVGTPYYVAPEVLFGKYGSECDMWSAGVILYILLCGYPPFHGKDNQEILKKVQVGEYSFDPRHWRRVSDHAKDLVKRCLTYVPGKRITAAEALRHPWIQCYTAGAGRPERPIPARLGGDLIERFKAFQRLHKLKKMAITCVAYQLNDADIGMLHDAFAALDTNADGVLTVAEIQQGLKQCCVAGDEMNDILKEMDTDGNGTIDYTEFIAASIDHKIYEQESACQAAFKVFDLDGDGKITVDELQKVLETRCVQEAFSKEVVAEMLKEGDSNNDGCIDFDEFMRMMRGRQRKASETASPLARARALLYRRYEN
ncbi:calcium-dependent protein kinase CDPK5 [Besnoitia besnoiti]|uniref:non-specific serine/threonine protein kinase n=1 Tax=Besnoitia besnoiti TaxID=94643 RepID=A0A2A9MBD4_BESBE|nr:calcium-dependent protein kinase CDPK5 [Besnoitia besnoiti]PFH35285.1 calcium-dependent protein kinase CDPK5 [Besnoitia besnoiti]